MADLHKIERRLVSVGRAINECALPKRIQKAFLHIVGRQWVRFCTRNLLDVQGLENAHALQPDTGVLLCSNHRSFFDMYVISSVLLCDRVPWYQDQFFPVRSNFFYERWAGLAVNLVMAGGAMYPPIFRDRQRAELNRMSVDRIVHFLQQPGVVVGVHPEGTRGKGPDPCELLPAKPGAGQIALQAKVPVLPVWINGLTNDLPRQIASNFAPPGRRGQTIVVRIGTPVDLSDLLGQSGDIAVYKQAATRILDDIRALGQRTRTETESGVDTRTHDAKQ